MKYIINIESNLQTQESLVDALRELAIQIDASPNDVSQPGKGHGYMGVYCNHATVQCRHFTNMEVT